MKPLRALLGAQFFTSLADNALLIVAIGLLAERASAAWMTPALRISLYLAYVALAPWAGALADALPKGRVMLLANLVKLGACVLLASGLHPLLAFAAVGVIGVTYGPAKYGILAELLPADQLVRANAWIEISTVASIIGGTLLGGVLLAKLPAQGASLAIVGVYALAAAMAAMIPSTRAARPAPARFWRELGVLWRDPQGKISLAVTTLFWAVAAALQFLVIQWAGAVLGLTLPQSALMQCVLAVGMVAGSAAVARLVATAGAMKVLPAGLALGAAILAMALVDGLWPACALLLVTGVVAGVVLVPMNALLQQRGEALMAPGVSIAVQSFSENLASLALLGVYAAALALGAPLQAIIAGFGVLVIGLMLAIMRWHGARPLTLAWRFLCVILHIFSGLATCLLVFPWIGAAGRMEHIRRWSRRVLRTFGVTVELAGAPVLPNVLLVANHISWVDVFVINAQFPSRFVAKSEVRRWPLIGTLSALAGTLYVARGSRGDLRRAIGELARGLRAGERVACFPEGTSAAQGDLQPFHANLFEAAIEAGAPVQAIAVSYVDAAGAPHRSVEYLIETSLGESMLAMLSGPPIRARLHVLPALAVDGADRRALARRSHAQVGAALARGNAA